MSSIVALRRTSGVILLIRSVNPEPVQQAAFAQPTRKASYCDADSGWFHSTGGTNGSTRFSTSLGHTYSCSWAIWPIWPRYFHSENSVDSSISISPLTLQAAFITGLLRIEPPTPCSLSSAVS